MKKSDIQNLSTGQYILDHVFRLHVLSCIGIYQIVLSWIAPAAHFGPQDFCAGAVDNTNVQSDQWCIIFLVGFKSPNIIVPIAVQGSASPLSTEFYNFFYSK